MPQPKSDPRKRRVRTQPEWVYSVLTGIEIVEIVIGPGGKLKKAVEIGKALGFHLPV